MVLYRQHEKRAAGHFPNCLRNTKGRPLRSSFHYILFYLYIGSAESVEILFGILAVFLSEHLIVLLDIMEIRMDIGLFVCLDEAACDI